MLMHVNAVEVCDECLSHHVAYDILCLLILFRYYFKHLFYENMQNHSKTESRIILWFTIYLAAFWFHSKSILRLQWFENLKTALSWWEKIICFSCHSYLIWKKSNQCRRYISRSLGYTVKTKSKQRFTASQWICSVDIAIGSCIAIVSNSKVQRVTSLAVYNIDIMEDIFLHGNGLYRILCRFFKRQ